MNLFPRIRSEVHSWWKALTHREQISSDASAELQFHIDSRAALLTLCAALACAIPAIRAASIDPMQALRYE